MEIFKSFVLIGFVFFQAKAMAFCLQTFNGYGPAYAPQVAARSAAFSREIKTQGCEVVHLQEVWTQKQIDIVDQTLKSDYSTYSPNEDERVGLMSFSKFPVYETALQIFKFNSDGGILDGGRDLVGVLKGFAVQTLVLPNQKRLDFLNLHLHPASQPVRLGQIYEMINWYRSQTSANALVLSGDFNMSPQSLEHQFVTLAMKVKDSVKETLGSYPKNFCTYCADNKLGWLNEDKIFDYVMYSPNGGLKPTKVLIDLKGTPAARLSDHYGLRVDFDFTKDVPARDLVAETDLLIRSLEQVMKAVANEYSKSSRIYSELGLWHQELSHREGLFWDYFSKP